jgi:Response regulator containing a CheY-like receiver domain and an HD-GYP domain
MEAILWGVRGSIASPSPGTQFYGANTTCIEVRTAADTLIIFDAGSGLRLLGETLPASGECHLFISHGHSDHIYGIGFFQPLNNPNWTTYIYVPEWLHHMPESFFDGSMFPVPFSSLKGRIVSRSLRAGDVVKLEDGAVRVVPAMGNHPGGSLAYKVYADDSVILYSGDHEITEEPSVRESTREMLRGVDLAIVDAAYGEDDYQPGWGHSTWKRWLNLSTRELVDCLVFSHHTPARSDLELDALQKIFSHSHEEGMRVYVAREGMRFTLPEPSYFRPSSSGWLHEFIEDLAQYRDEGILLDRILTKAREITLADAGTVYMADGKDIVFAYTHNDTLFPANKAHKYAYADMHLPVSKKSIAGYAAITGRTLNIPDVHNLPKGVPYRFNHSFDAKTGYVTQSMLTIPFFNRNKELLGVLQLINSVNPRTRQPQPFAPEAEQIVMLLAREAAVILEISALLRDNIYRLLRMASVHDPTENGPHAERVGALAAELYQAWAEKRSLSPDTIRYFRSQLRLAAMVHDIGKVGISDLILKKPGKLDDAELTVMRTHTMLGASLLTAETKDITDLGHDIALHHHQKWDGSGYSAEGVKKLAGEEIPLMARITALADVYDALVSPRCYKEPWTQERAMGLLREESGKHFDPELVRCFEEIMDTVSMIYKRFPDVKPAAKPE